MKLLKQIEVHIFVPLDTGEVKRIVHRTHADKGRYFIKMHVKQYLEQEQRNLVMHLPEFNFELIKIADGRYNFVGKRVAPSECPANGAYARDMTRETAESGRSCGPIDSPARAAFPENETPALTWDEKQRAWVEI